MAPPQQQQPPTPTSRSFLPNPSSKRTASVRRPRPPPRVSPFRDDSALYAVRYEQTVQAAPPIPIVPRKSSSLRLLERHSSAIIVAPPPISPHEQHPALRPRRVSEDDDWKRDSGLVVTVTTNTTSSSTIHEADDEYHDDTFARKLFLLPPLSLPASPSAWSPTASPDSVVLAGALTTRSSCTTTNSQGSATAAASVHRAQSEDMSIPMPPAPGPGLWESPRAVPLPTSPRSPTTTSTTTTVETSIHSSRKLSISLPATRNFSLKPGVQLQANKLRKKASAEIGTSTTTASTSTPPTTTSSRDRDQRDDDGSLRSSWGWPLPLPALAAPKEDPPYHPSQSAPVAAAAATSSFLPITTAIPTDGFFEDDFLSRLTFSNRGSIMFGEKRAIRKPDSASNMRVAEMTTETTAGDATVNHATQLTTQAQANATPTTTTATTAPLPPNIRVLPIDVERESQKVRSLYEAVEDDWIDGGLGGSSHRDRLTPTVEVPSDEEENVAYGFLEQPAPSMALSPDDSNLHNPPASTSSRPNTTDNVDSRHTTLIGQGSSSLLPRPDSSPKRGYELAGGIEDWEDVDGADVDRYGFINPNPKRTDPESRRASTNDPRPNMHSATTPKKRNVLVKRLEPPQGSSSSLSPDRYPSRKISARSLNTQASEYSTTSRRSARSSVRAAANLLPHNRDRKLVDEARDMLSLAPGLSDIAEDDQVEKLSEAFKKKEWERAEKWRRMAKINRKGQSGQGMEFEFDPTNPKVIDRTWKGIPDRWRAAAWYSFLTTSARHHGCTTTDEELVGEFHRLQSVASSDDTQIDLDVPRTVNRHIMFRRRYRGGQRLLFRVLHALSLHFPDTGYVQGMASLAATLLCYFDEEKTFIMLDRMWRYRGLERLYQPGFGSLMIALKDFERDWLGGRAEMTRKLGELGIDATAYATRWYLTLFNLSIPFQAQLRVWDVFMLLGEPSPIPPAGEGDGVPVVGLEVLHATGSSLMHGLAEVLLDSDFENAMKALTSWVPVKDEDLLMKVTRSEWKKHRQQAGRAKKAT